MSSTPITSGSSESLQVQEAKELAMSIGMKKAKADNSFLDALARKIIHFKEGSTLKCSSQL